MADRSAARRALLLATIALSAAGACSREPEGSSAGGTPGGGPAEGGGEPTEITVLRERAAALYGNAELNEGDFSESHALLEKLAASPHATAEDVVDFAAVKLKLFLDDQVKQEQETPRIVELCQRALQRDPACAAAHYVLGVVAFDRKLDPAAAKGHFEEAHRLAPDDVPTRMRLAEVLGELEQRDRAIELYESVRAQGVENSAGFYLPAIYRLARVLRGRKLVDEARGIDDTDRAKALLAEHRRLSDSGVPNPSDEVIKLGTLGRVRPPRMQGPEGTAPAKAPELRAADHATLFADWRELLDFEVADVDSDLLDDVVALGVAADGTPVLALAKQGEDGAFAVAPIAVEPALLAGMTRVRAFDLDNEFAMNLLLTGPGGARLLGPEPSGVGGFVDASAQLPAWPAGVADVIAVDFGHDGQVDLALATASGLKLLRNDGIPRDQYTKERTGLLQLLDATALAEGIGAEPCRWVTIEDFDGDQDIDLLAGGEGCKTLLYDNLRKGRFAALESARHGLPDGLAAAPLLADLDHDGAPDALVPGAPPLLQRNRDGRFAAGEPRPELAALWRDATLADVDLDGELDFVGASEAGQPTLRCGALTAASAPVAALPGGALRAARLVDVDGDGDYDLIGRGEGARVVVRCLEVAGGRSLHLALRGKKDNRHAIGAIVELRAGARQLRSLQRDRHFVAGLGGAAKADLVRITWPNGVVQHHLDLADGAGTPPRRSCGGQSTPALVRLDIEQKEGLAGSCPFLYSWNGETYEFVSDVLGITPLGLPMTEAMYVPPDHDELVRVTGAQLRAVDGEYRFQLTEELREVTYLDRVQLWVIDHPADVAVHPEERFCFPPFPPQKIHTVRGALPVVRATDQQGRDWSDELAGVDGRHAVPFEPHDSRYLGLVTNHSLELALPEAARTAKKVRLLMTGWLYWTDASVNVLADRNGSFGFVPPTFAVPDGQGGWRDCGPPVGFPAGKTKTMVVDVSDLLVRDDLRLRVSSSIRLYWDAIEVAVDDDDAPITVTKLEPTRARLWSRGFSAPIADARPDQPERFDWDVLEPFPRWNQHAGMLTRYGAVEPLLSAVDDCFAIFSAGDAIDLRFDATGTPPREGMGRTYLVFFDGWAKDADPNTMHSQSVLPLPFHGMSGYPYRADERYPDDELHLDYQLEWNTRPGRRLIPSLASPHALPEARAPVRGAPSHGTGAPAAGS